MNSPLISVIVPSYNQGDFIENTILSVIGQSYANWELIIQDGNSKDNTKTICKKYALSDSRITFISEPDNGFADAVNKAITKCKGTFCAIQSSDDFYSNASVFQDVAELYNQHPELKIITGSCQHISSDFMLYHNQTYKAGYLIPLDIFTLKSQLAQGSTFFLKDRVIEIGLLDPTVDMVADTDLWIRMAVTEPLLKKENIYQTDKIWSYATVHLNQRNSNQAPFYFGRALMSVNHLLNEKIKLDKDIKKQWALRLFNDAFELFSSQGKQSKELESLYFKITNSKLPGRKKLKSMLSKNSFIRKKLRYHFSKVIPVTNGPKLHIDNWTKNIDRN